MDRKAFFSRISSAISSEKKWHHSVNGDLPILSSGLNRYRGKWGSSQVTHLLKRAQFGARPQDIAILQKKSMKKALRLLLQPDAVPTAPVNNYDDDKYTDDQIPAGADWTVSTKFDGMNNGRRKNSFKAWWLGLMINQPLTIQEKMVLFLHNHFATETNTVDNALYCYRYNTLLRQYALGNFKELVKAISTDAAMLRYLNGYANSKKAPDENYGRELQELFTVGKGPDSHYTEDDVKAAARVLTGYTINNKTFTTSFDPKRHDDTDKEFSAFYGGAVVKGRKDMEGALELDDLLTMIFSTEEVSKFICRKLYRYFVYHTIDDQTETLVITPLARLFRKKDYEIKPVLEALLSSEHFFDMANYGCLIKSPVDFVVGTCREFDVGFPEATSFIEQYGLWDQLRNQAASMQQNIGDPPNVAGWQAYYQEPEFDKLWISSDTLPKRNQFTDRMISNGFAKNAKKLVIDPVAFASRLPNPGDPEALINDSIANLYAGDLSLEDKRFIKNNILLSGLSGEQANHYWTTAWTSYQTNPDDKPNQTIVINKLKALYKYLMNRPEYQLC